MTSLRFRVQPAICVPGISVLQRRPRPHRGQLQQKRPLPWREDSDLAARRGRAPGIIPTGHHGNENFNARPKITQGYLAPWPIDMPPAWPERVDQADDGLELESLRLSVQRGRPFGQLEWQKDITRRLRLQSAALFVLRPRNTGM